MAASSSLSNSLSFLSPSKPLPPKTSPTQLTLPLSSFSLLSLSSSSTPPTTTTTSSQSLKYRDELVPVMPKKSHSSSSSDLMSVVCPSLAYANTLFFKSAYNVQVIVGENEHEEKLIGRFRREVFKAGIIQECKHRRFFESTQVKRKRKSREAAKRNRKRRPQKYAPQQDKQETSKKKDDDKDDNWEFVDVELPYCD